MRRQESAFRTASAEDIEILARLSKRSLREPLDEDELRWALQDEHQEVRIFGDPDVGVVAVTRDSNNNGYIRFIAVDRDHRKRGIGSLLLTRAEHELSDSTTIIVGCDAPHYLYPGVNTIDFDLMCLLEKHRFRKKGSNLNLQITKESLPEVDLNRARLVARADSDEVTKFCTTHWPRFSSEIQRAIRRCQMFLAFDEYGMIGFSAFGNSRKGWIGPIAVRPDLLGSGHGKVLLAATVHHLNALGFGEQTYLEWVGPIRPYARMGATMGPIFIRYEKERNSITQLIRDVENRFDRLSICPISLVHGLEASRDFVRCRICAS